MFENQCFQTRMHFLLEIFETLHGSWKYENKILKKNQVFQKNLIPEPNNYHKN